jgi:class 3 adenylate cyclase
MIIVHYEVYVLEGRGWMLHARFPRTERETAINEAKELEHTLGIHVRVLRETYYTDDNAFEEAEIYTTGGGKGGDKAKGQATGGRGGATAGAGAARSRSAGSLGGGNAATRSRSGPPAQVAAVRRAPPPRPVRKRSPEQTAHARQLIGRLLAITALALACALLSIKLTPNAIMFLWQMGFNLTITPQSYGQLLFAVFVITFLMVAVPLSMRFLPRQTAIPRFGKPTWGAGGKAVRRAPQVDPAVKKSLDKLAAKALAEEERGVRPPEPAEEELPEIDVDDLPQIKPSPDDVPLPEIRPDPEDTPAPVEDKRKNGDKANDKAEPEKDGKKDKKQAEGAAAVEALQPAVMRFLSGAVTQAKSLAPNMDAFTKFALHLYMAGAVEALCDFRKQGDTAKSKLVATALETLGTRGELATKFYDKLEEYLMEPRYLGVVQAGRDAMGDFMLGDESGAHRVLRDALQEWNRKSDKKAQIVTVMFTDMVGSTDMTQARGDAGAQEVVRRHNSIVRGALAQFGGKEVKHTGDGIMASFNTAAAAVEATISIQRQVDQQNQRQPNLGLHLRIGLNAGEPIQEEDDLFGATVQLAARVCAATNSDETLCTGVVKDLTVGKGAASFRPVGEKYLKGFKDAIPLYEVLWRP